MTEMTKFKIFDLYSKYEPGDLVFITKHHLSNINVVWNPKHPNVVVMGCFEPLQEHVRERPSFKTGGFLEKGRMGLILESFKRSHWQNGRYKVLIGDTIFCLLTRYKDKA